MTSATVLRVLYLVFNEGYCGEVDLADEAIRLTRQLTVDDRRRGGRGPARADAAAPRRRAARTTDPTARSCPLAEQDRPGGTPTHRRGGGDPAGGARPRPARRVPGAGRDRRPARRRPDGRRDRLGADRRVVRRADRLTDSPVVRLNRAVAVGEADGARAGLAALAGSTRPFPATHGRRGVPTRADGDPAPAARLYANAARRRTNLAERDHLTRQAARLNVELRR